MFFNRSEFDRYVITNSWGSSTEFYNWDDLCSIEMELPDYVTQKKYVDVYNAMFANQQNYEHGLEDLKLTCDVYIEDLRRKMPTSKMIEILTNPLIL
jgi:type I restriction enzyme S subunit